MQISLPSDKIIYSIGHYGCDITSSGILDNINPVKRLQQARVSVDYIPIKYNEYSGYNVINTGDSFNSARIEMEFNDVGNPYPLAYFLNHSGIENYNAGGEIEMTEIDLANNYADIFEYLPTDNCRTSLFPYAKIERIELDYNVRNVAHERYTLISSKPFEIDRTMFGIRGHDISGNQFVIDINDPTIQARYVLNRGDIIASISEINMQNGFPNANQTTVIIPEQIQFPMDVLFVFDFTPEHLEYLEPDGEIGGLRKGHVNAYLVDSDVNFAEIEMTDRLLGVQDVSIDISLNYINITEYANDNVYDRILKYPINVDIRISVLERDLTNYIKYSELSGMNWLGSDKDKKLFVIFKTNDRIIGYMEYPSLKYTEFLADITVRGDRIMYYNFQTDRFIFKYYG